VSVLPPVQETPTMHSYNNRCHTLLCTNISSHGLFTLWLSSPPFYRDSLLGRGGAGGEEGGWRRSRRRRGTGGGKDGGRISDEERVGRGEKRDGQRVSDEERGGGREGGGREGVERDGRIGRDGGRGSRGPWETKVHLIQGAKLQQRYVRIRILMHIRTNTFYTF